MCFSACRQARQGKEGVPATSPHTVVGVAKMPVCRFWVYCPGRRVVFGFLLRRAEESFAYVAGAAH